MTTPLNRSFLPNSALITLTDPILKAKSSDVSAPTISREDIIYAQYYPPKINRIEIPFNEAIRLDDGVIELHEASDQGLVESFTNGVGSAQGGLGIMGDLMISPGNDLKPATEYYLTFSDHVIRDSVGNAIGATTVNFTTDKADSVAPQINSIEVPGPLMTNPYPKPYQAVSIIFDENIRLGNGAIQLHKASDHSVVASFDHGVDSQGGIASTFRWELSFTLAQALTPGTEYYFSFSGDAVTDLSGNAVSMPTQIFKAVGPDIQPPELVNLHPERYFDDPAASIPAIDYDNYQGATPFINQATVPLTSDFLLQFNIKIHLGSGEIGLYKAADHSIVETFKNGLGSAGGSVSESKTNLRINPGADLEPDTAYYLTIADNTVISDKGGVFPGFTDADTFRFTSIGADHQAPEFRYHYAFSSSQADIRYPTSVSFYFNEDVQLGTGELNLRRESDHALIETFKQGIGSSDSYISVGDRSLVLNVHTQLSPDENYYITISDNAIIDGAGNAYPGVPDIQPSLFSIPPASVELGLRLIPAPTMEDYPDDHIGKSVSENIMLWFSDSIKLGAGAIVLHNASDQSIVETFNNGVGSAGGSISANSDLLIIDPAINLLPATHYYVTVEPGAILGDTTGEVFSGISDSESFYFFTAGSDGDQYEPYLIRSGGTDIRLHDQSPITLSFIEQVQLGEGSIELHKVSDHSLIERFDHGVGSMGGRITINSEFYSKSKMVDVDPASDLLPSTAYYLTFSDNAITDLAGNSFVDYSTPGGYLFWTTELPPPPDLIAPQLFTKFLSLDHLNKEDLLSLQFDESINLGGGVIEIHRKSDGRLIETFTQGIGSLGDRAMQIDSIVDIRLAQNLLEPQTEYYLTISDLAITDAAGNAFAGISDPKRLSFVVPRDTSAPELIASQPVDNQTLIALDGHLQLEFNESVRFGNGRIELHQTADNSLVESFTQGIGNAGGRITFHLDNPKQLDINPAAHLLPGTQYYLTISNDGVTDLSGNAFPGFIDSGGFNFKTGYDPVSGANSEPELTSVAGIEVVGVAQAMSYSLL